MRSEAPDRAVRATRGGGIIAGVCAGLGRYFRIDPLILRVGFIALGLTSVGILAYLLLWALLPRDEPRASEVAASRRLPARGAAEFAAGVGCLLLSVLLVLGERGVWLGGPVTWSVVLVAVGVALLWRQFALRDGGGRAWRTDAGESELEPVPATAPLPPAARRRATIGAVLIIGGTLAFLGLVGASTSAANLLLVGAVVLVAGALVLVPWWMKLWRGLSAERAARIRSQERAEVAAHLHDSVLQTLALVQARAQDPVMVVKLARRQERELRTWLAGGDPGDEPGTLAAALRAMAADVEDAHGVIVEVVTVGDRERDGDGDALVAAAREALVNAARHAGAAGPIALYMEADAEATTVYVRDRGKGFDPEATPEDRRGVRDSIIGRMERHGGRATITSVTGEGTEVELRLDGAG